MKTIRVIIFEASGTSLRDCEVTTLGDILDHASAAMGLRPNEVEILNTEGSPIPWREWQRPATDYFADGDRVNVQEIND